MFSGVWNVPHGSVSRAAACACATFPTPHERWRRTQPAVALSVTCLSEGYAACLVGRLTVAYTAGTERLEDSRWIDTRA